MRGIVLWQPTAGQPRHAGIRTGDNGSMPVDWLGGRLVDEHQWLRPSPRLAAMRRFEVAGASGVTALVLGTVTWVANSALTGLVVFAIVIAAGVGLAVLIQRRVRAWGYAEREDDLLVRRGILFSRLSVVPYGRMQFVDVTAGPLERMFGLVTVRLHTAAAASDARIPGLDIDTGARLRDRLAALGEARASGL